MRARVPLLVLGLVCPATTALAQSASRPIALVKMPYRGERNLPDLSDVADYLEKGGIAEDARGARVPA